MIYPKNWHLANIPIKYHTTPTLQRQLSLKFEGAVTTLLFWVGLFAQD